MTLEEVNHIMGTETFSYNDYTNPDHKEQFYIKDKDIMKIYYYWTKRNASEKLSENEKYTPILFVNGIVGGIGWRSFEDAVKKYQLSITY